MASVEHITQDSACVDVLRQISKDDVIRFVRDNSSVLITGDENIIIFGRIWDRNTLGRGLFTRMLNCVSGKHVIIFAENSEKKPKLRSKAKKAQRAGAASVHVVRGEKTIPQLPREQWPPVIKQRPHRFPRRLVVTKITL